MNDFGEFGLELDQLKVAERAFEDGVLDASAVGLACFGYVPKPLGVSDVVGDNVASARHYFLGD